MTHQHGTSSKYVARQITLTSEIDAALRVLAARSDTSPSAIARAILAKDPRVAALIRPESNDLMAVPEQAAP